MSAVTEVVTVSAVIGEGEAAHRVVRVGAWDLVLSSLGRRIYQTAHERAPDRDDALEGVARLASSLDLHAEALDAYGQLSRKHPDDTQWTKGVVAEKDALSRATLQKQTN